MLLCQDAVARTLTIDSTLNEWTIAGTQLGGSVKILSVNSPALTD